MYDMEKKKILAVSLFVLAIAGVGYAMIGNPVTKDEGSLSFVSGTEYAQLEQGATIIRITDGYGAGVTANWCNETIYFPNKTIWLDGESMTEGGASGSWYYDFVTPSISGIYEQYVRCGVPLGATERIIENSKAFHVSDPLTLLNETGSAQIKIIS